MFDYELVNVLEKFTFQPDTKNKIEVHLFKRDSIVEGRLEDLIIQKTKTEKGIIGTLKFLKVSGTLLPIEQIRYIKRKRPVKPLKPNKFKRIKANMPFGFVYELTINPIPVTFLLYQKEFLTALFRISTLYSYMAIDRDGYPYIIFKHAVKAIIPAYDKLYILDKGYLDFDKNARAQPRRVPRREWQFRKDLSGRKLFTLLKKETEIKLREGISFKGKLIGLEEFEILLKCGIAKILIMRHAIENINVLEKEKTEELVAVP